MARQAWAWAAATASAVLAVAHFGLLPTALRFPLMGMLLFSRIPREDVLEHETRRRILETVYAEPGLTLQALQQRLGVAWGTAVHHVHRLERHGTLVSVRQGPRRLLYAAQTPEARARVDLALLRTVTAHSIAKAVRTSPGIQQVEVCRRLGLRGPSASKHLSRLATAGLVVVERAGGSCRYNPTPRLGVALDLHGGCVGVVQRRPPRPRATRGRDDAAAEQVAGAEAEPIPAMARQD